MATKLTDKYLKGFVNEHEYEGVAAEVKAAHKVLHDGTGLGNDFLGWLNLPTDYDKEEFARIKAAAEKIKKDSDVFIVIGIGGSYLGARAAIEFLTSQNYNLTCKDTPQIYFTGNSISSSALAEIMELCEGKDVSVNMISKSGTTTEPAIAFRVFREMLEKKYGKEGARERIYCTTDKAKGTLKTLADEEGYETFVVPDDVGGRFSVLTAVGLLPIAVSGADIDALMQGAATAQKEFDNDDTIVEWLTQYSEEKDVTYVRGFLGRMLFAGDDGVKKVKVLSGGEKVRCLLSKMMISGANVLILDEPTDHLDMESITALNNGMKKFPGVLLFSSRDHQIVETTANRIMEILPGGKMIDKITTYDEYLASDATAAKRQAILDLNTEEQDD